MDMISRIYCADLKLRAYTVTSPETAAEITKTHKTTPNATVALGRTITAAALLSATLKPETGQSILLKFSGEGPLKEVHVQADACGNLRGYVANPSVDVTDPIGRISFSKAIGAGLITVIKDIGMKEPYNSLTPILYGEVAEDLAYYLVTSEQVPSAVIIGLNLDNDGEIKSSGGILIQTFPDTEQSVIDMMEENVRNMRGNLGDRLEAGENIYEIVKELFNNSDIEIMSATPLAHKCRCSHDMLLNLMKTLDKKDIQEMIEKDGGATVTCTFCLKEYRFTPDELKGLG